MSLAETHPQKSTGNGAKRLRHGALTGALVASLALVTACGGANADTSDAPRSVEEAGSIEDLAAAAREAGPVSLYVGTTESETKKWASAFTEEYGVDVTIYRASSTTMYERWAQETGAGQDRADVIIHSTYQLMEEAIDNEWVAPYTPENDTELPDDIWPDGSNLEGVAYPLYLTTSAVVWNTYVTTDEQEALLDQDPVAALADPSFDGLVALNGPSGGTTVGDYGNILLNQEDEYGWEWLDAVAANGPATYESGIPLAEALVAGEYAAALSTDSIAVDHVLAGAPVEFAYADPAASGPWMMAQAAGAPNPAGAALFMEWATSEEGHDLFSEISGGIGTRVGWEDEREINEYDWYEAPESVWTDWQTDPRLQGEKLNEFINRVNDTIGF